MLAAAPVAPLAPHPLLVFLLQVALLLLLALCLGRLAVRLRMPAIVGELLAGVLVGPSLLGRLAPDLSGWLLPADPEQMHLLDAIGQFSVLLLVGMTGVQLDVRVLARRRGTALRISLAGQLVSLSCGIALGYLLPASMMGGSTERSTFAVFLGVAMCVSAIPVIAKTLADMRLLHRDVGQLTLVAGMFDDAIGWFLLSVVSAMATVGVRAGQVSLSVAYLAGFVLFAVFAGRRAVRLGMRLAARSAEPGPMIALTVVIILLGAATTQALRMEPVFGALVAGILVSASGVDLTRLAPLRTVVLSVLAPIFLASAGLRIDLGALTDPDVLLVAVVVVLTAVVAKFSGVYVGARRSRLTRWESMALGAGLNARGAVEVVVAMVGLRLGVLTPAMYTVVVLVAIVTSLMAPPVLRLTMARVEHNADEQLRRSEHDAWSREAPDRAGARESPPGSGG